jgi:hypothetical protein
MEPTDPALPSKADEYHHPDGTTEVVVAVEDGSVLTVTEYPSPPSFERAVADATYVGIHDGVAEMPGVEAFRDGTGDGVGDRTDRERGGGGGHDPDRSPE